MTAKPRLCTYYWRDRHIVGNMGDTLVPILLGAFGYDVVQQHSAGSTVLNAGRCLLVIGSLLNPTGIGQLQLPADVWGCGWKGSSLTPACREKIHIYAVRGPISVKELGLSDSTPIGDPALLLSRLVPRRFAAHHRTIVIPHFLRATTLSRRQRLGLTGCHEVLPPMIIQPQQLERGRGLRELLSTSRALFKLGVYPRQPWSAVARIAGAEFVLTGSLHGAILAQAYDIPWAGYDDSYVDAPAKWQDWAAYLGIRIDFVKTLAEGRHWWATEGRRGRVKDLNPLLAAFPYPNVAHMHADHQ